MNIELFVSRFEKIKTESALGMILADYNKILIDLQNTLSDKNEFNINHFLPKSEYSQLFVASKMIQQINKYNGFFQALPQELKTKIAVSTISSDFAEEEAKDFYLSCV